MTAETRSYIFRWRTRCCQRRVCVTSLSGSLTSCDGFCNESVTWLKENFYVRLSVTRLFQVGHVVQNTPSALSLAWHEWFSSKGKEWRTYCWELALSSEPQKWKFHVVVWQMTSKNFTKMGAARAARSYEQVCAVLYKTRTWNYLIYRLD